MAKIIRKQQKIFGSNAGTNERSKFGSLAAGAPLFVTDPDDIQSLSEWLDGWFDAVVANNSPAIEDMNSVCFVLAYNIAYGLQAGVAEWSAGQTYYIGSLAQNGFGRLYVSLTDTNLNNALTDTTNWRPFTATTDLLAINPATTPTKTLVAGDSGKTLLVNSANGACAITLPTAVKDFEFTVKDAGGAMYTSNVTIVRPTSNNIENVTGTYTCDTNYGSWTFVCDGTNWWVKNVAVFTRTAKPSAQGQLLVSGSSSGFPAWSSFINPPSAAGTASTPTYSWDGSSSNSGFFLNATDEVALSSNGTLSWKVSAVGIQQWGPSTGLGNTAGYHTSFGSIKIRNGANANGVIFADSNAIFGANVYRNGSGTLVAAVTATGASYLNIVAAATGNTGLDFVTSVASQTAESGVASATSKFTVSTDGVVNFPQVHNIGSGNITSGRYTPTITAGVNISAVTAFSCLYSRVGNIVTVSGQANITTTLGASNLSEFAISLPISSNLTSSLDLAGTASREAPAGTAYSACSVNGDPTNDRARVDFNSLLVSTNNTVYFTFQYEVK